MELPISEIKQMIHDEIHKAHTPSHERINELQVIEDNYKKLMPMFKRGMAKDGSGSIHKNPNYNASMLKHCDGCDHDIPKQLDFCPFCDSEDEDSGDDGDE